MGKQDLICADFVTKPFVGGRVVNNTKLSIHSEGHISVKSVVKRSVIRECKAVMKWVIHKYPGFLVKDAENLSTGSTDGNRT